MGLYTAQNLIGISLFLWKAGQVAARGAALQNEANLLRDR